MIGDVQQSPPSEDWGFRRASGWKKYFCITPQKCHLTGERIWFKMCYRGVRVISGPGTPVYDYYYVKTDEFLIWQLSR